MEMTNFETYNKLRPQLGDDAAQEIITLVNSTVKHEIMELKQIFLTKDDKLDIMRSIYYTSVINFLAIVGAVLAILTYISKN